MLVFIIVCIGLFIAGVIALYAHKRKKKLALLSQIEPIIGDYRIRKSYYSNNRSYYIVEQYLMSNGVTQWVRRRIYDTYYAARYDIRRVTRATRVIVDAIVFYQKSDKIHS